MFFSLFRGHHRLLGGLLWGFLAVGPFLSGASTQEVFYRPGVTCVTVYKVSAQDRITITRTYQEEGTQEVIELRPLHPQDAGEVHALVSRNSVYLYPFMSFIVARYGQSVAQARRYLQHTQQHYQRTGGHAPIAFGIFFRACPTAIPVLLGSVGLHSFGAYSEGSVEISYWLGKEAAGKGLAFTSTKGLCLWASYTGKAHRFNMVMEKENGSSYALAMKLPGVHKIRPSRYKRWGYALDKQAVRALSVMASDFLELFNAEAQATKSRGRPKRGAKQRG